MKPSKARRAILASLAAIATAGMFAFGLGGANAANISNIDPNQTATLSIHKFETPSTPTGLPNDGTALTPAQLAALTPMPGVTFTVQPINGIDLTTNAGWTAAAALTPTTAAAQAGAGTTVTTDASGNATLSGLPLGLYLVTETSYPAGVTPSAPFLVTLPLTNPTDTSSWLYNVNVYPKNSVTTATKTVNDANAIKLGDPVSWTIKADIPDGNPVDGYKITDQLDTKLTYSSATVSLSNGAALTSGTDYTVVYDSTTHTLTVNFTTSGLAILTANATAQVVVDVNTTVNTVGEISNTAVVYPNAASFNVTPGQPGGPIVTPPVVTKWGDIVLHKQDSKTQASLAGATFQVYPTQADAQAGTNAITINGVSSWTTDASGNLVISGLRYSNWVNGAAVNPGDPGYQSYWLVETQAPTGYELLAQPVETTVTSSDPSVVTVTIDNVPHNAGFQLPFTGGPGTWALTGGGILLLTGAVLFFVFANRRKNAAEAKEAEVA
ncbi:SpaH/EbpB family LPXTG-anchored major pilin [Arthrobacter sp. Y-9]|uniref:SpaH/EbpB family LPXTG-anchored major pilin n=1 Tax=Arthrobacter sp. Y-9 TaxID=3039385 RepID=UPI0024204354|nr:SpaH/EbpB family LPXTG-anchored major pilin [Arthrobacter sp. Y-9]WFR84290.1 SpaH/EbpB family LPXTG-anchored major pilin [Arthrobacter sp. Y-9]